MSERTAPDPHTLVGPYVLDALPPEEREQFEDHLSRCPECQAEAAELLVAAAHLGQATAVVPPSTLRAEVLAEVARTRQVAPGTPALADDAARRPRWMAPVAMAAALLVVLALGSVALRADRRADQAEQVAAITASADAQTVEVAGEGGTMRLVVSNSHGGSVVVAADMPAPPAGKTYALWFDEQGRMVLHGTFSPDGDGSVRERVRGVPSGVVGVTVEDAGSTPSEPTFPTVASGQL